MSQRFPRALVLLLVTIALQAAAEEAPDIRALLSNTGHRIFSARIVGVMPPKERAAFWTRNSDDDLRKATFYWLGIGAQYERVWYTTNDRLGEVRFRAATLADVLELKFRDQREFTDTDRQTWTNIAFALAVNGDSRSGAEILDILADIMTDGRTQFLDDLAVDSVRSDANALWTEHALIQNDIHSLLDTLGRTAVPNLDKERVGFDRRPLRLNIDTADQFNHALILEKLGLHGTAVETYRQSLKRSTNARWNDEARQRIDRITLPSRPERWSNALARLNSASHAGNVKAVRDVVRTLPEQARKAAEQELLTSWARSALVGSVRRNASDLELARNIGAARRDLFADSLVADTVRLVDDSIRENDARRIESFARAFLLYRQEDSASTLEEAAEAFESAQSPMANVARFHAILKRFDAVPIDQSLEQLRTLGRSVPAGHRVLRALIEGAIGNCLAERAEFGAALEAYGRAQRVFEALGEVDSVAVMRASSAHMLTFLGHPEEAWRVRRPALSAIDAGGDPGLVELVLRLIASDLLFERKKWQAISLYGAVLPVPPLYANPGDEYRESRWRNPVPLYSKQVMLDALSDKPLRPVVQNELRLAQALHLSAQTGGRGSIAD